jgi:hypothetical protein
VVLCQQFLQAIGITMYWPAINGGRKARSYRLGNYLAVLVTDCESMGQIEYTHVLLVYQMVPPPQADQNAPLVYAVAAEKNSMQDELGGDSHFLGVFPGTGHMNFGASEQWADLDHFVEKAIEVTAAHFNITEAPILLDFRPQG